MRKSWKQLSRPYVTCLFANNLYPIVDFSQALGGVCGLWEIDGTTASDYAQATKALGDKLGGGGGAAATPTASSGGNAPAGSDGSSPSSSKNAAGAVPTAGVFGVGAAAAAAMAALL